MSSTFGNRVRVSIFGQSHGEKIGAVIDGLPAGEPIDEDALAALMARRALSGGVLDPGSVRVPLYSFISSALNSLPRKIFAPSFFAAVMRSSIAQYSLSLWLPDDAAITCPPAFSAFSYSSTSNPLIAMVLAAVRPDGPAPMTITLRPCPSFGMSK